MVRRSGCACLVGQPSGWWGLPGPRTGPRTGPHSGRGRRGLRRSGGASGAGPPGPFGTTSRSADPGGAGRVCAGFGTPGEIIATYECSLVAGRTAARDSHRGSDRIPVRPRPGRGGRRACPGRRGQSQDDRARRGRAGRAGRGSAGRAVRSAVRAGAGREHRPVPRGRRGAAAGGERDRGGRARAAPRGGRAPGRAAARDADPGRGAAARIRRGQDPVARRAGRAGPPRAARFRAAAVADAGAGHRAAAA